MLFFVKLRLKQSCFHQLRLLNTCWFLSEPRICVYCFLNWCYSFSFAPITAFLRRASYKRLHLHRTLEDVQRMNSSIVGSFPTNRKSSHCAWTIGSGSFLPASMASFMSARTCSSEMLFSRAILLLRQLYIRKLPLTRYCRSNNCHAFRLPRKGREKRHFNHLINAALQSSVYGYFIAALITIIWAVRFKSNSEYIGLPPYCCSIGYFSFL